MTRRLVSIRGSQKRSVRWTAVNGTALIGLIGLAPAFAQALRTMRLDFYHTGTATREVFSVDRVVIEPTPKYQTLFDCVVFSTKSISL